MYAQKLTAWKNTLHAAMNPDMGRVMVGKLMRRLAPKQGRLDPHANMVWLQTQAQDLNSFLARYAPELQNEVVDFQTDLKNHAKQILSTIPYDLGGGGGVPLLYALVRQRAPVVVVETGVAAGFSSATILAAFEKNNQGILFSSDFPYFRIPNPEQYVGVVVKPALKSRWHLYLKGDAQNLPEIFSKLPGPIDLFHYDSDKSYHGRDMAMQMVAPHLAKDAVIVMDDIQDNSFFHDYVTDHQNLPWAVFAYEGKYIGLIGQVL